MKKARKPRNLKLGIVYDSNNYLYEIGRPLVLDAEEASVKEVRKIKAWADKTLAYLEQKERK